MIPRMIAAIAALLGLPLAPGVAGAEEPARRTENVIVVTLDGFRPQEFFGGADESLIDRKAGGVPDVDALKARYWRDDAGGRREALLPFIWGTVAKQGQVFGDASKKSPAKLTNGLKFSYPGYNEIFCGFGDPRVDSNDKVPNPNRSVLEFLDGQPAFKGRVAAYCTWDVFPSIFRTGQNSLKLQVGCDPIADEPLTDGQRRVNLMRERLPNYWPGNAFDFITTEGAREYMLKHKPRVMFIGLGETDEWAHGRRYDLYLESAYQADRFLEGLWGELQRLPEYKDKTALILTTDHGRGETGRDWTDHGKGVEGAEFIWIAAVGPDIPALGVREGVEATQSQVAATIAHLLGEDFVAASPKSAPPLPFAARP